MRWATTEAAAVVGHDFGSPVAAYCALVRPDVFPAVALMSAPVRRAAGQSPPRGSDGADINEALAALDRPRKHYQWYYGTRPANDDMLRCDQGVADFLRAYYHVKSADWPGNHPFPLAAWSAEELAKMPTYYIMDRDRDMAQIVAPYMPTADQIAACQWLTEPELAVYAAEFTRTGFQGGLQWYRCGTSAWQADDLRLFAGRTIDQPSCFISGAQDWGIHQVPGALEAMQNRVCTAMSHYHLVDGAGHWVQQEQPEAVVTLLFDFLRAQN